MMQATLAHFLAGSCLREASCMPFRGWLQAVQQGRLGGGAVRHILIAASGSSRHAALASQATLEAAFQLPVDVIYASEYAPDAVRPHAAVLVLSQSGETADTLFALREANRAGLPTLAITNVAGSSMDREASASMLTLAGLERAIPATKSFTAQLLSLHLLGLYAMHGERPIPPQPLTQLHALAATIAAQLASWNDRAASIASKLDAAANFLFLGRGAHAAIASEGALKLKECAYLPAEGYPAGELKHGPNALVSPTAPVVVIATGDPADAASTLRYERTLKLLEDLSGQGANLLVLANPADVRVAPLATHIFEVEPQPESLLPLAEVIPLQLFAFHMAMRRGIDVDRPRNLHKSVLAE